VAPTNSALGTLQDLATASYDLIRHPFGGEAPPAPTPPAPPAGTIPPVAPRTQEDVKTKYGLPATADITKPYFDPANKDVKDADAFSRASQEFNPPPAKPSLAQRALDLTGVTDIHGAEGGLAPRTVEETISPLEWIAGETAMEAAAPYLNKVVGPVVSDVADRVSAWRQARDAAAGFEGRTINLQPSEYNFSDIGGTEVAPPQKTLPAAPSATPAQAEVTAPANNWKADIQKAAAEYESPEEFEKNVLIHGANIPEGSEIHHVEPRVGDLTNMMYGGETEEPLEPLAFFKRGEDISSVHHYATGTTVQPKTGVPHILVTEMPEDAEFIGEDSTVYDREGNLISRNAPVHAEPGDVVSRDGAKVIAKIPLSELSGEKSVRDLLASVPATAAKPAPIDFSEVGGTQIKPGGGFSGALNEGSKAANTPEWVAGEYSHEINRLENVLRNPDATAEDKAIAGHMLQSTREQAEAGLSPVVQKTATPENVEEFKHWFGESKMVDDRGQPVIAYHGTTSPVDFEEFSTSGPPHDEEGNEIISSSGDPNAYMGAHFAIGENGATVANKFAENKEGWMRVRYEGEEPKPRVIPVHLKLENPINFKSEVELDNFIHQGHISDEQLINEAAKADGIEEPEEGGKEIEAWQHRYDTDPHFRAEQNAWILRQSPSQLGYEEKNPLNDAAAELGQEAQRRLKEQGHDGVIYKNAVEGGKAAIAFEPDQIRHAIPNKEIASKAFGPPLKSEDVDARIPIGSSQTAANGVGPTVQKSVAPANIYTQRGAQSLTDHLKSKMPDADISVVGSVAQKGESAHDLDLKISGTHDPQQLESALSEAGFRSTGSSVVTPKEVEVSDKDFGGSGWKRAYHFESAAEPQQKIDVWVDLPNDTPEVVDAKIHDLAKQAGLQYKGSMEGRGGEVYHTFDDPAKPGDQINVKQSELPTENVGQFLQDKMAAKRSQAGSTGETVEQMRRRILAEHGIKPTIEKRAPAASKGLSRAGAKAK
jgi:ADP-Ribosyltransferase in polyvalent proteins